MRWHFLVAIGVLVAVHEYGHFWMARRHGYPRVALFDRLWPAAMVTARQGWIEYAFSAIPLGGYVKASRRARGSGTRRSLARGFNRKPSGAGILVLLAGPFANFLFAALAYWILFVVGVPALKPVIGECHG
jgi:regulator of sigma E protease